MVCQAHLGEVQEHLTSIRSLGGELIAVCQADPGFLRSYLEQYPRPFPVLCDPKRAGYSALGLEHCSWGTFFRPGTLKRYLNLIRKGWIPRWPRSRENLLQLGGDFVIAPDHRLVYAYRSPDPSARPRIEDLLQALRIAPYPRDQR